MAAVLQSQVVSLDAPIGGWDTYSSLDNMPPENAVVLDNLIPAAGTVETRLGQGVTADLETGSPVETLEGYRPRIESNASLIAASGGKIFEVFPDGTAPIELGAGFTNNRWQTSNFRKADEEGVLIMCNGEDSVQIFGGGAVLGPATFTDGDNNNDPIDPKFIGVEVFKGRSYYWLPEDNAFYYCQAGGYQGEVRKFDLGSQVGRGGSLKLITTWTQQDSGDGKDDFIVFFFTTGELLVYQGDDPENIAFWELVGKYRVAEPTTIRGAERYGSDTILMTKDGYVNLASIIQEGRTSDVPQFSRMVAREVRRNAAVRGDFFGWECDLFPAQSLFVFNVPLSDTSFEQHVMNTLTQRWCRFRDINCSCFTVFEERLFGGSSDGRVLNVLEGTSDLGEPIQYAALPAFQYLGDTGRNKHLVAASVLSTHPDPSSINLLGLSDYNRVPVTPVTPYTGASQATWSVLPTTPPASLGSFWDEDFWATNATPRTTKGWQNISAYGYAVSYLLRFAMVNDPVVWRSTNIRFFIAGAQ